MNATTKQQTILTNGIQQAKLKKAIGLGYLTFGIHFAPSNLCGAGNVCSSASKGCRWACLNTSGRGIMKLIQRARARKTVRFLTNQAAFLQQLRVEIGKAIAHAHRKGLVPCFRLNLTSDVLWEELGIIQQFPECQFYDYTKHYSRYQDFLDGRFPDNYWLTFSRSENTPDGLVRSLCEDGGTVAAVFRGSLPKTWLGLPVIDGDANDLRFLDLPGEIVGLVEKGLAKQDETGFVIG